MVATILCSLKYIILKYITFSSNVNRFVTKWKHASPANVVTLRLLIVVPCLIQPCHAFTGVTGIRNLIGFYSCI